MKPIWKYFFGLLILVTVVVWLAVIVGSDSNLHIIACDVGQGDAILLQNASSQILVDGGPGNKVLDCLSRYMPFWDRTLEVVVMTHPQSDHYGGLIEVFRRYNVGIFLAPSVDNSTQGYQVLKDLVKASQAQIVNPQRGMKMRLGEIQLDILNPTAELQDEEPGTVGKNRLGAFSPKRDLNDFSVVFNLSYGSFDALFTGDIGPEISDQMAKQLALSDSRRVEYIKIPHHGSRNGLTGELLDVTSPEVAVISVGKDNTYGHPHEETLKILRDEDIKILRTDEMGSVEVVTDGEKWWVVGK